MRNEQEIFDELAQLCIAPGYIHAIAGFCFRDNLIKYNKQISAKEVIHLFSRDRLIRTEISTLIGLMIKEPVDFTLPSPEDLNRYFVRTEKLLNELHEAMMYSAFSGFDTSKASDGSYNPFSNANALREPIFYGGEAAYPFQYRDLAPFKYGKDDEWIKSNKGFSIHAAKAAIKAILAIGSNRLGSLLHEFKSKPRDQWTILPGFVFTAAEISECANLPLDEVTNFLSAFSLPHDHRNRTFQSLHDFNEANAFPILRWEADKFLILQYYSLVEAVYDGPFYWMVSDKRYSQTALKNRGQFTEEFARERLSAVFGEQSVYTNVEIYEAKGKRFGEIDVLVVFGNRAIVLQAKSKKLTIEARKGNDNQLQSDFKKAVQEAYDQAYSCAQVLEDKKFKLVDGTGKEISIPDPIKEIFPVCIVSDHYPALSFQARQFLNYKIDAKIKAPVVTDVFALDIIADMLDTPLRFLSYLSLRVKLGDKLLTSHELTTLAYHLKENLWLSDEVHMLVLDDSVSADLDVAMLARHDGLPGKRTPDGILTRQKFTTLGRIVQQIEARPDPATIDFGLMALTLSEETTANVSRAIDKLARLAKATSRSHDATFAFGSRTGLTLHCNSSDFPVAVPDLERHCNIRKYSERAENWFGLLLNPGDGAVRLGVSLDFPWKRDGLMDELVKDLRPAQNPDKLDDLVERARKVRRNDLCPCGSGLKYKKCCLR
jgi:hypothetical protein